MLYCVVRFEWSNDKAARNLFKHGVSFEEAKTVFDDPLFVVFADPIHSLEERRFIIIGETEHSKALMVAYTERDETTRIISARKATPKERKVYEEQI